MKEQKYPIQKSVVEWSEELQSKEKSLILARESLRECCDNLQSKKVQLDSIQRTGYDYRGLKTMQLIQQFNLSLMQP